jgi:hypothetical protein
MNRPYQKGRDGSTPPGWSFLYAKDVLEQQLNRAQLDDFQGIDVGAVDGEAPVEMRAGDASGGADLAEDGADREAVTNLDSDLREVTVEGVDAQAVVDEHGVAGKVERFGEDHAAGLGGVDGSAGGGGEVHAGVRGAGFAVEDAAAAEIFAARSSIERDAKFALPQFFWGDGGVEVAQALGLVFGACELFGVGLDELGGDFQAFGGEFSGGDIDACFAGNFFAGALLRRYRERGGAGGGFEVDGKQGVPTQ